MLGYQILRDHRYRTHYVVSEIWEEKHCTHFDTEIPSINIVSKEEIPCLRRVATDLEQLHQVEVLTVDIATHGDRSVHFE